MTTIEQMTSSEVCYCVSSLVSTLADHGPIGRMVGNDDRPALAELIEQAFDLACPIDDWEEAAAQAGWQVDRGLFVNHTLGATATDASPDDACGWEDLCSEFDIEPYQREVYEHWLVTDWFADKLIEAGEKVDKDFAGMTVWARTTTGQAIYADGVIERIYAELNRPDPEPEDSPGRKAVLRGASRIV